jgi:hypothetical protein
MGTPMRPWAGIRMYGHCQNLAVMSLSSVGQNRAKSRALATWVTMTRTEVIPRRPCRRRVSQRRSSESAGVVLQGGAAATGAFGRMRRTSTHLMFRWFGLAVILSVCPVLSSSDLSQQEEARRQKETRKTQHGKYGGTDDPPHRSKAEYQVSV